MKNTERTDIEKLCREPVKVTLGGVEYDIHPKPILSSRKWKAEANKKFINLQESVSLLFTERDSVKALRELLFVHLDDLLDLVFLYESNLPKDKILTEAYEDELIEALIVIFGLAFPLAKMQGLLQAVNALNTNRSTVTQ